MRKMFLVVITLVLMISGCKTSKYAGSKKSAYQPPKKENVEIKEPEKEFVDPEPEKPILMKTEDVTLANKEDVGKTMFDYYVILGSFENAENANNLQKEQMAKGFTSVVLKSETGMLRVAVLGTNSESEARNLINEIRIETPQHSDVWLLKKK